MNELLDLLRDNWFLLSTFVALVLGWGRFEWAQRGHGKAIKKHDEAYAAIEKRFDEEVISKINVHDGIITGIKTDIEWTKKTLERLEGKIDTYFITHRTDK